MNKRITSLALVFVMVLSLLATAVPVLAAPGDSGVTASVTQAAPGDTFSVTLKVPGTAKPISDLSLKVRFDNSVFEVTKYTIPDIDGMNNMQSNVEEANRNAFFSATYRSLTSDADIQFTEGLELTAYFKVKAEAPLGDYEFKLDNSVAVGSLTDMGLPDTLVPYNDFVNKTATIKVVGAPNPATDIRLNKDELTLTAGATETLVATVTPSDTTDTVAWSSNKPEVATVDSTGKVTAVAPGEATITAKAGEKTATCTVKVSCAHNLQTVPAKDSNCTEKGWDAYQKCTLCGALFDMSGGSIEGIPYRPLNDNHDFNTGEWGYKGADGHAHVCARDPAHKDRVVAHTSGGPATEDTAETCTDCGYVIAPAIGHVCANHLTEVEAKPADCTNSGNKAYYKCECGKFFEDADALTEIIDHGSVVIPALDHAWAGEWSKDGDKHWHACTRCDAKNGEAAHNPGLEATEDTPQTCTECGYVLAPATGHLCVNHLEEVDKVAPTCTETGKKAHYKCSCDKLYWDDDAHDLIEGLSELDIDALDHAWAGEWSSDATNHWHACTRCDAKTDEAAHTPAHPDGATFEYPVLCVECGYEMEAQREEGTIRVELPFKLTVNKTGELDPGKEIFKFMAEEFGAPVEYELITSTLETNGAKTYEGIFIFTIMEGDAGNLSEGFIFRQVKGEAEGWTYDESRFYAVPMYANSRDSVYGWQFFALNEEGRFDYENVLEEIVFTNSYNAKKPVEPSTPDNNNPQTGDNSNLALWIVLLIASGSATSITLFSKKRKMNAK